MQSTERERSSPLTRLRTFAFRRAVFFTVIHFAYFAHIVSFRWAFAPMSLYSPCLTAHSLCTLLRGLCAQLFDEKLDQLTVQHVYVCARIAEFVSQCFLRTTIHIQTNIHQVQFQWCVSNRIVVDLQRIQKFVVCTTRKSPIYKCLVQVVVTNVFQILLG